MNQNKQKLKLKKKLCRVYAKRFSIQNHKYGRDIKSTKKDEKFPKKNVYVCILKLKRAKNSYGGYVEDFFSRDQQKFQAAPQKFSKIFQKIPKKIKLNQN
jgi:hypothetical protein